MKFTRIIKVGDQIADLILTEKDLINIQETFKDKQIGCELGHPRRQPFQSFEEYARRCATIDPRYSVGYVENVTYDKDARALGVVVSIDVSKEHVVKCVQQSLIERESGLTPKLRMFTGGGAGYKPQFVKVITFDLCPLDVHGETVPLCPGFTID